MSLPEHAEDPLAAAGAKVAGYVSVAVVVAEAAAQLAAARARNRAVVDERQAAALRAQHRTDYARARMGWAPVLDPELRARAGVREAGLAWAQAQQWRPDPEAERVTTLAEDRLRTLRPDVMARYDQLCAEGTEPVEAMRRVADDFDGPTVRTGQPAPVRAALAERDRTRRPGDAEIVRYQANSAAPVTLARGTYPAPPVGANAAADAPAAANSLAEAGARSHRGVAAAAVAGRTR